MRTYLVTGGAGFIGSNYIHYMFKKYGDAIRIINLDVLTYAGNPENLKDVENRGGYTFIKADICDKEAVSKIFAENDIDRVVHFAAESHVDRSIVDPEIFLRGSFRTATSEKERNSCMCLRTRCTVPCRMMITRSFMKLRPMRRTVPIRPARRLRICW